MRLDTTLVQNQKTEQEEQRLDINFQEQSSTNALT